MHAELEFEAIAILILVVLVGASILGKRLGVAAPLLLVLVGIGIGYLPFVPLVSVPPEIILFVVLPPLLYSAAVSTPLSDFRRNLTPIAGLSVLLVLFSALLIGWLLHLAVPAVPFPVAVALGAVISPTDAVAATSIGKKLGMPDRLVSILEGESLVNDATSLVLLKTSIAAIAGSFALMSAVGNFAYSVVVAILIGLVIGFVTVRLRSLLRNPVYDTVISFTVPFIAFIPAELAGASGVLAVVVTGLYTGHHSAKRFSATARINERLNWRTMQFIIENGVFLLMGLELHSLVTSLHEDAVLQLDHLGIIAVCLLVALILLRGAFVALTALSMRGRVRRYEALEEGVSHTGNRLQQDRLAADIVHEREQPIGWRESVVLSWSGMRGVVTLAAAQTIPTSVELRPQLVILAFLVAVMSLLLHGLTLPAIIRRLWPGSASEAGGKELEALTRDLVKAGDEALDDLVANPPANEDHFKAPSDAVVEQVRVSARGILIPVTLSRADGARQEFESETPAQAYLRLAREVLEAQRQALLEERAIGRYSAESIRAAEIAIDAHEIRLSPGSS